MVVLVLGGILALSCSLTTNADRFDNAACPSLMKGCNDACVPMDAATFGCTLPGCRPCDLANAVAGCDTNGACDISGCIAPFHDCNQMASDGCEVDVGHDALNCGQCGCRCGTGDPTDCDAGQNVAPIIRGVPGCRLGTCVVGQCDLGWGDCDDDAANGCETPLDGSAACGVCGTTCDSLSSCICATVNGRIVCGCEALDAGTD